MYRLMLAITCLMASPALAGSPCAPRATMAEKLSAYGEAQTGLGTQGAGRLVELWASDRTGSWTMLMTFADGRSCIMAAGQNWTGHFPEPEVIADPA